jgi:hypothetical protein
MLHHKLVTAYALLETLQIEKRCEGNLEEIVAGKLHWN